MANIVQMKDSNNAVFYPQTHEKAVVDSNGVNLQTKLQSITTPTYVTAWDGASTPVVANIPAGVSVTYNTTTYTGTLAASASTANKTYLVSTGTTDNYNRYVTQLSGSTYSWQNLGSTEIDLSDYATKAELSELGQKVAPIVDAADNLGWDYVYTFDKTKPSSAVLSSAIALSQEGDSIEFYVTDVPSNQSLTGGGYAFAGKNATSKGNIAMSYGGSVYVRADDDSWIFQYTQGASRSTRRVKIVYNASTIDLYVDGSLVSTYEGVKALTIYGFGNANNTSNYGYWSGKIAELKVNGSDVQLASAAALTDVEKELAGDTTFLAPSDLVDNLQSDSKKKALTAKQGKVLKTMVDENAAGVASAIKAVEETKVVAVTAIPGVVKLAGVNSADGTNRIAFTTLQGYDSYYFYPGETYDLWFADTSVNYISITTIENASAFTNNQITGNNPVRYRKNDNNLPTAASPITLSPGMAASITITAGATINISRKGNVIIFNPDTPLAPAHVQQVSESIGGRMSVAYNNNELDIFIRSGEGFIKYVFLHSTNQSIKADIWGMSYVAKCDGNKNETLQITTAGEWEAAIKIANRDDFCGGIAHGDEMVNDIAVFVDGAAVDLSGTLSSTECDTVHIIEATTLYDPDDHTTEVATHTLEYVFTIDGLTINQTVTWLENETLAESYMAMFPISQEASANYCFDTDFTPKTIPEGGASHIQAQGVKRCVIWDATAGVFCEFGIGDYTNYINPTSFLMHNNGGTDYNKCYFFATSASVPVSITAGDKWKTTTVYQIR